MWHSPQAFLFLLCVVVLFILKLIHSVRAVVQYRTMINKDVISDYLLGRSNDVCLFNEGRFTSLSIHAGSQMLCQVECSQVSKSRMRLILDLNTLTCPDILDQQWQSVPGQFHMSRGQLTYIFLDANISPGCQSLGLCFG